MAKQKLLAALPAVPAVPSDSAFVLVPAAQPGLAQIVVPAVPAVPVVPAVPAVLPGPAVQPGFAQGHVTAVPAGTAAVQRYCSFQSQPQHCAAQSSGCAQQKTVPDYALHLQHRFQNCDT